MEADKPIDSPTVEAAPILPLELVNILLTNLCDEDVLLTMLISKNFLKVGIAVAYSRPIPILFRYCRYALTKIKENLDGSNTARPIALELTHPDKDIHLIEQILACQVKVIKLSLLQNVPILADKAKWLCRVIGTNTTLRELSVQTSGAGAVWFGNALLQNHSLRHFMVESNTISQDTISAFTNVLKQNTTLTSLSLGAASTHNQGNFAQDKMKLFADALAQNKTLKSLRLFNTYFTPAIACLILDVLKVNTTLKCLELPGSQLCSMDNGVNAVIDVINTSSTLTKLDISYCSVFDYGKLTSILEALKQNQYIEDLNISSNDVSSNTATADALRDYLQNTHVLQHLYLDSCGIYDLTHISKAIIDNPMICLRTLSLNNDYISNYLPLYNLLLPENGSAISVLSCQMCGINFSAVQLLCDALKNNRRLTKLNLYGNSIGDAGAEYVAEMLKVNSSLTYLNLGKNNILDQGGLHLARVFGVLHGDDIDLELQPRQFDISNYSPQLNGYHHSYYRKETTVVNTVLTKPTNPDQLIYLNKFHLNKSIAFLSIERNLLAKEVQAAFRKIMERNQKVHVDLAYCDNPNAEDCVIS